MNYVKDVPTTLVVYSLIRTMFTILCERAHVGLRVYPRHHDGLSGFRRYAEFMVAFVRILEETVALYDAHIDLSV